jgi:uncharacterized DUF497 family protein
LEQDREVEGETRWQAIVSVGGLLLLVVAHTVEYSGSDETIRIISARKANRRERIHYEKARQETLA